MEKRFQLDTKENAAYLQELGEELLKFGVHFPAPSGASYYLGSDGAPMQERPLETWITCRMAHSYCLGRAMGFEGSEGLIDQALRGIRTILHDDRNGGWYPGITADGKHLPEKQCYAHAFVILAAASALLNERPGAAELLKEAEEVFLAKFWDEEEGLSRDTWNTEFTELSTYRGLNANMHSVEAFLAVADVTGEEVWRQRAGRIIAHVLNWAEGNAWRIPEHFTEEWKADLSFNREKPDDPFKPYGATPGHGIEWARLITQWAYSTYREEEKRRPYVEKACRLYEQAVKDGWNADGEKGIVYTTDWDGTPVVHDRMHWTLAEAINTSAVLFHVTGDRKYAEDYAGYLQYLEETVRDPVHGSWYHQLDEHNRLKETVWPGKSDLYHALQSTLIPRLDPSVSVAVAAKKGLWWKE
ncbi:MAG: AGE family epimerase/isomerase [Erysipelotrichaceae bacterium]|nr:AGE family epimerase/isomerase [Erysipelotrichaceae bacterium]